MSTDAARPGGDRDDPVLSARAAWSLVAEPGDAVAGAVVQALGAFRALRWARWAVDVPATDAAARLRRLAREAGPADPPDGAARAARVAGADADPGGGRGDLAELDPGVFRVLARAVPRWAPRLAVLDVRPALDALAACGGTLLAPGRPGWPEQLGDLGPSGPLCLWVRGPAAGGAVRLDALSRRSVAVVGARAATAYGERVAADLAAGLVEDGVTVVSGGAFGIDVAAHRSALLAGGRTVALLAGGVDRPSPEGNRHVLERLVDAGGALVAESPPGMPPTRSRFLQRNRLIAALTGATVVVEAAWRSGALSTAARAAELMRPVGAVPGPVTSMASAGCHRLLRDGAAVCVTDAGDVLELLGARAGVHETEPRPGVSGATAPRHGADTVEDRDRPARVRTPAGGSGGSLAGRYPSGGVLARVLDALPRRGGAAVAEVARRAGLAEREVAGALGRLELEGAAHRDASGWRPGPCGAR